jgi:hypothetical protein
MAYTRTHITHTHNHISLIHTHILLLNFTSSPHVPNFLQHSTHSYYAFSFHIAIIITRLINPPGHIILMHTSFASSFYRLSFHVFHAFITTLAFNFSRDILTLFISQISFLCLTYLFRSITHKHTPTHAYSMLIISYIYIYMLTITPTLIY